MGLSSGYDAEEILGRMRADADSDWPDRLLTNIGRRPLVDESAIRSGVAAPGRRDLSQGEVRVLEAFSRGMTAEMAAEILGVTIETVKSQLKSARYRIRAKNTTHACCEALRQGLLK